MDCNHIVHGRMQRFKHTKVIAVANSGCGKTTTTINLAVEFGRAGLKHLITHKSVAQFTGVPEPGGEIHRSLQALPDGLDSMFSVALAR